MKTAAILNFWDCEELLPYAVLNWFKCVDTVIIVFSDLSNYGERKNNTDFLDNFRDILPPDKVLNIIRCEPIQIPVVDNERRRRNVGLEFARQLGVTHFVITDADEFYEPDQFKKELKRFDNPNLKGLICGCQTYFGSPTLTIGLDTTRITFIHKLTPDLRFTWNPKFPFAWDGPAIRIDPTRQLNITDGVEWSDIICHHYSWVRKDPQGKIRNSTARANLERSTITEDLVSAKDGYFCKFYQKRLYTVENRFGIPDYGERIHEDLQQGSEPLATAGPTDQP